MAAEEGTWPSGEEGPGRLLTGIARPKITGLINQADQQVSSGQSAAISSTFSLLQALQALRPTLDGAIGAPAPIQTGGRPAVHLGSVQAAPPITQWPVAAAALPPARKQRTSRSACRSARYLLAATMCGFRPR